MTQEELNKLTKDFNSLADEAKQTMMLLANQLEPVVKWLKGFADWVQRSNFPLGNMAAIILTVVAAKKVWLALVAAKTAVITGWNFVMGWFGKTTALASKEVAASGPGFAAGAVGLLEFGVAMALVTVPIAAIVLGFAAIAYGVAAVITAITKLAEVMSGFFEGSLGNAAMGVAALANAIKEIPIAKTVTLTAVFGSAAAFNASAAMTAAVVTAATGGAPGGARGGAAPAAAGNVKVSLAGVVLKVNDRELGKFVEETVEGKLIPVRAIGA